MKAGIRIHPDQAENGLDQLRQAVKETRQTITEKDTHENQPDDDAAYKPFELNPDDIPF